MFAFLGTNSDPPQAACDLFSQLCRARAEVARCYRRRTSSIHEFLMMAAHDTLTSSLTSFISELAAHPEWQTRLRDEVGALGIAPDQPTTFDNLEAMHLSEMASKEALRQAASAAHAAPRGRISTSRAMEWRAP
jgi:cytochrome P450